MECLWKCPQLNTKVYTNLISVLDFFLNLLKFSSPDYFPFAWSQLSTLVFPSPKDSFGFSPVCQSVFSIFLFLDLFLWWVNFCSLTHHFTEGTFFLVNSQLAETGHDFSFVPLHCGPQWYLLTHPWSDLVPRRFLSCFCKHSSTVKVTSVLTSPSVW